ncbi:MAG TPA: YncE family protein [Chitinophagaceae bacterium]|jgi:DNA-binding beta-propeller fold protein YncE
MIKVFQYGAVSLLLLLVLYMAARVQNALYKPYRRIRLGDYPLWEFMAIDEARRHLLVASFNKVLVIDMDTDEIIHSIACGKEVYGIAVAPGLGKGFVCHRAENAVTVIDLQTLQVTTCLEGTGPQPEFALFDAWSGRLFVFSSRNNIVTVIDPIHEKVETIITLPYKPALATSDEKGNLFIQAGNSDMLLQLDARTLALVKQWCVVPNQSAGGLATDSENNLLFCAYDGQLIVVNTVSGEEPATVAVGAHPGTVVFDPSTRLLFCANGEGTISIIKQHNPSVYKPVQRLATQSGCRLMVQDPVSRKLYLLGVKSLSSRKTVQGSFEVLVYGLA